MGEKTFAQYEYDGWQRNAAAYAVIDLPTTCQAISPILQSIGKLEGLRILELASGTGHLAEQAVAGGASVVGIDVSPKMVAISQQRVPIRAVFQVGDAVALPFDTDGFDGVVCSFGLMHFAQPDVTLREAARVLKPNGVFSFTVWCSPEQDNQFFGLIAQVFETYADLNVDLPSGPPSYALAVSTSRDPMLTQSGFSNAQVQTLPIIWPLRGPDTLVDFVLKGSVRTRMLYERQTAEVQARIREALMTAVLPYINAGNEGIPCPAILVTAYKEPPRVETSTLNSRR